MPGSRRGALFSAGVLAAVTLIGSAPGAAAQGSIVGGERASLADFPYAVYLVDGAGTQFCGGVIVSLSAVATAAHCAEAVATKDIRVVVGREDKRADDGATYAVSKAWVHPGFTKAENGDDIAVLTVRGQLPSSTAKLALDAEVYEPGTKATVVGWGRVADGGDRSDYLRSAVVPMVADSACKSAYASFDAASMVCAGYEEGGVDACQGDSGGPLVVGDTLAGIVSFGDGCAKAGKPGVYTRVTEFAGVIADQAHLA
ncbi:trypsin-like serine protease [Amycolatopsis sp. FDAARGOS 1241]|uniref:S1 family peptidase n=1 Tax=Amycolatopsis sp. FDAARGOS 1241 TaxID=2778070 RepID=UPI00195118D8|nr:serine protease [Amycolatopsis sp. FDAARGOS 1241]QRP43495.1 serine protease [Amycolatopsis sp. FDAARGOS 1241]